MRYQMCGVRKALAGLVGKTKPSKYANADPAQKAELGFAPSFAYPSGKPSDIPSEWRRCQHALERARQALAVALQGVQRSIPQSKL